MRYHCFCWEDVRRAISGIAIFAMVTSTVQILVTVAVFTGVNAVTPVSFDPNVVGQVNANVYRLYIALSCGDFLVILTSLFLICGNERLVNGKGGRSYFYPWLVYLPFYMMYEIGINIYYFYYAFTVLNAGGFIAMPLGFSIVPLCYWAIKELLLICGYILVFRHVQPCHSIHPGRPVVVVATSTPPAPCVIPAAAACPAPARYVQQTKQQQPLYAYQPAKPAAYVYQQGGYRF